MDIDEVLRLLGMSADDVAALMDEPVLSDSLEEAVQMLTDAEAVEEAVQMLTDAELAEVNNEENLQRIPVWDVEVAEVAEVAETVPRECPSEKLAVLRTMR
jgi:hypothetical protein